MNLFIYLRDSKERLLGRLLHMHWVSSSIKYIRANHLHLQALEGFNIVSVNVWLSKFRLPYIK